jgi:hypothetical protein
VNIREKLVDIFQSKAAGPFLFLGSGFSRRYLSLEDWRGLLEHFCVMGKPFEYYLASANGDFPRISELIAEDFNKYWWEAEEYKVSVERNKGKITDVTSTLRIEISNYLSKFNESNAVSSIYKKEVELLSGLNVDGIITTNWDIFIEQLFPDYKVYIGQEQLLFSNPQEIGEIYKIHGCSSNPHSLILTKSDYDIFQERNAYLAAKLITLFVEHPIVFIGYSMSDENICSILKAISLCIGKDNIEKLRKNLIFVQRLKNGEDENISDTYLTIDGTQIPIVLVKTDDFTSIYESIEATKRKIPARILRFCKEQLYELVQSAHPEQKLCVVDIDDIEKKEDVEFLVGVGVVSKNLQDTQVSEVGYTPIRLNDLIMDLLHNDKSYNPAQILNTVLPDVSKTTNNVPVFKYLQAFGITNQELYLGAALPLDKLVNRTFDNYKSKSYIKSFFTNHRHKSLDEIIETCTPENAAVYIPFLSKDKLDLEKILQFLITNESKITLGSSYVSNFRKLASFYDKLKYGW